MLQDNMFVERMLPGSILRSLSDDEMATYRKPFVVPGEARRPTLSWPRQIPIDGEPPDVAEIIGAYADWLPGSSVPKLFVKGDPGGLLSGGALLEFCRTWRSQSEVTVRG